MASDEALHWRTIAGVDPCPKLRQFVHGNIDCRDFSIDEDVVDSGGGHEDELKDDRELSGSSDHPGDAKPLNPPATVVLGNELLGICARLKFEIARAEERRVHFQEREIAGGHLQVIS